MSKDEPKLFTAFSESQVPENDPFSNLQPLNIPVAENSLSKSFSEKLSFNQVQVTSQVTPSSTQPSMNPLISGSTTVQSELDSKTTVTEISDLSSISQNFSKNAEMIQMSSSTPVPAPVSVPVSVPLEIPVESDTTSNQEKRIPSFEENFSKPTYNPRPNSTWLIDDPVFYKKIDTLSNLRQTGLIIPNELLIPKPKNYNQPSYFNEIPDDLKKLCLKYLNHSGDRSNVVKINDVDKSMFGVQYLIKSKNLHAAAKLIEAIMIDFEGGVNSYSMEEFQQFINLWHLRIGILVKLGKYRSAEENFRYFMNFGHSCFYFRKISSSKNDENQSQNQNQNQMIVGTFIPFSLRLLQAEIYLNLNKLDKCREVLTHIDQVLTKIETKTDLQKNFPEIESYRQAFTKFSNKLHVRSGFQMLAINDNSVDDQDLITKFKIGYGLSKSQINNLDPYNKGIYYILNSEHNLAYEEFLTCLGNDKYNQSIIVNNMAISLVYQGKLEQAINLIESRLDVCVHHGIIKNLCQMIDLKCNKAEERKAKLLERLSMAIGDSYDVSVFNFGEGE